MNFFFVCLGVYNAKQHPDVKSGKKNEEEVLGEFLDTFEMHHANLVIISSFNLNFLIFLKISDW